MSSDTKRRAQLGEAHGAIYRGMLDRDTEVLDTLLDRNSTLTHLTGYRQSRAQ